MAASPVPSSSSCQNPNPYRFNRIRTSVKLKISSVAAASAHQKYLHPKISCQNAGSSGSCKNITRARRSRIAASSSSFTTRSSSSSNKRDFDVVIVGAGIIGLAIARQFLLESDLSVAIVDAAVPCSGATGAGQGYIWMTHKTPGSDLWELEMRSKKLWETLAVRLQNTGLDPLEVLGWQNTGSLLIGRTSEEAVMLKERVEVLSEAGLRAEFLSLSDLLLMEPALEIGKEGGAAFLADDCQLDARRTVAFIEKENRDFASKGRYADFYNDPTLSLLRASGSGEVEAVQTSKNTLYCKKAVVIAAGSWTGTLMQNLLSESNVVLDVPVKPRKGHLLVVENFHSPLVHHGLMEVGYVDHKLAAPDHISSASEGVCPDQALSISMTATMDAMGNLLLGSSRQFAGFNTEIDHSIVHCIWKRAGEFFPTLRELDVADLCKSNKVRVGLRPYMPDGKPVIGPIPGLPNLVLAAGHEGGGLSMALGTAEMVVDMVLGRATKVDSTPFSIQGRRCNWNSKFK